MFIHPRKLNGTLIFIIVWMSKPANVIFNDVSILQGWLHLLNLKEEVKISKENPFCITLLLAEMQKIASGGRCSPSLCRFPGRGWVMGVEPAN